MSYTAPRWLHNAHAMTIAGALLPRGSRVPWRRQRWELADGDFLDVDRLSSGGGDAPAVVVCHGLEGSSDAGYVRNLGAELAARGLDTVALNFRGCSGELNRLPRFYHSGETSDLHEVLTRLIAERPGRALALVGFSLGGNVVMKYLGERGAALPAAVRAAAAVCTPFRLARACEAIDGPGLGALLYRRRFLRRLRHKARAKARLMALPIDFAALARARLLREFDDAVTAPLHGFSDAADYYARASAGPLVGAVARPTLILQAIDDPIVPYDVVPEAAVRANPQLTLEAHARGGHVAFVEGAPWRLGFFAERRVAEFLAARLSAT